MIAAIVLAAGRGTRFAAGPKMLAEFDGRPLVRHVAETALASRARPVLAVLGHEADAVLAALAGLDLILVENPDYRAGLSTSLRAGFAALPPGAEGALVCLGDMPRISARLLDALGAAWLAAGRPTALVPTCGGRRGNPVLLARALAPAIATLDGDTGAGPLLRGRSDVVEHETGDSAILADIDTADALARLQASTTPSSTAP
ncbi:MAG: nucleotidyltransferase family protein [Methylobacteriaceae bacterium]|nr:nucleotidyltransferase family protein [Methylobacteriaceae bacterium]